MAPARGSESGRPPRRRFLVVHNPYSGPRWRHALVERVVEQLIARGARVERAETQGFAADCAFAEKSARGGCYDAIVAAGGDGTLRSLAAGTMGLDVPLGLIPLGTGNVMAEELRHPRNPAAIARSLIEAPSMRVRPGLANGVPFLLMAGAGVDARILARMSVPLKRRVGQLAYAPATLSEIARPLTAFPVVVDGIESEATWAIVTRVGRYAGRFLIARGQSIGSAGFHAVLVRTTSRARLLVLIAAALAGRLEAARDVEVRPCDNATLGGVVPVQVDGEEAGLGPLDVTMAPAMVRLIVP